MRISASGLMRDASGIGVLQRQMYPELVKLGIDLDVLPSRDIGTGAVARAGGIAKALTTKPAGDAFLSLVSPLVLRLPVPTVAYVHDLRWKRTRGRAARTYREADFRRTMRCSDRVIAISQVVADDIAEMCPRHANKVRVVHSGPGQVTTGPPPEKVAGRLLLMGADPHKRNEEAIEALCRQMPAWVNEIVGINLSEAARAQAQQSAYRERFRLTGRLTHEEFVAELGAAEYSMHLGTEEGFGLPYIEALALGCQVVVVDQPLTRELMGDAAMYVSAGVGETLSSEFKAVVPVSEDLRQAAADRYSWAKTAAEVRSVLQEAIDETPR